MTSRAGITLETALATGRQTLASVAERAKQHGYYSGARTEIINAHADLRAALDMLVKAAESGDASATGTAEPHGLTILQDDRATGVEPRVVELRRRGRVLAWCLTHDNERRRRHPFTMFPRLTTWGLVCAPVSRL
jgi:hypothetical protein